MKGNRKMLLFIICLVLVIGGFILGTYFHNRYWDSTPGIISYAVAVVSLLVVFVFGLVALGCAMNEDAYLAEQQAIYDSLVYQIENNLYDNDNDIGKFELLQQITEWNSALSKYKIASKNIWYGMTEYQCYDQLQFIPLEINK